MSEPTTHDYEAGDGIDDGALDMCPHCETVFAPPGPYSGSIYDKHGRSYEHLSDTDVKDRPFFCQDCFEALETNRRQQENSSLGEFA